MLPELLVKSSGVASRKFSDAGDYAWPGIISCAFAIRVECVNIARMPSLPSAASAQNTPSFSASSVAGDGVVIVDGGAQ